MIVSSFSMLGEPESAQLGEIGQLQEKTQKNRRKRKIILIVLFLSLLLGTGLFVFSRESKISSDVAGPQKASPVRLSPVRTEEPAELPISTIPSVATYESERFRAGDIVIGGEAGLIVPESDTAPLEITTVRGESFIEKGKNKAKLVITWETNKPALSEVTYGKGVGQAEGIIREEAYGTSHSLVIPDLSQASTYVYVISGHDKWGNIAESEPYAVYTGSREVSLFELIAGAVGDVFGWAVDR